jgi:hypothetical protein
MVPPRRLSALSMSGDEVLQALVTPQGLGPRPSGCIRGSLLEGFWEVKQGRAESQEALGEFPGDSREVLRAPEGHQGSLCSLCFLRIQQVFNNKTKALSY